MNNQSDNHKLLARLLHVAHDTKLQKEQSHSKESKVHIAESGGTVTAAYEQLRNAAEYAEEHLLLQRAIRRFYRRVFMLNDKAQIESSGHDLAIELTQAGYLKNDTIPESTIGEISKLAREYYAAYLTVSKQRDGKKMADEWVVGILAVRIEWCLNSPDTQNAFVQFVHHYFTQSFALSDVFAAKDSDIELALYVAIHRALFKSDSATIRASLLDLYKVTPENINAFKSTNTLIGELLDSPLVDKLTRYVDRKGAPLRVLRHRVESNDTLYQDLENRDLFLSEFESQVSSDYSAINTRINRGIIKSVIFLIITKFLLGLSIEIPYDLIFVGAIVWLPLIVNLFFPPIYMILLRMTLMLPGVANTNRLVEQIDTILYQPAVKSLEKKQGAQFGAGFNIAYALVFLLVFGGVGYLLWRFVHFEWLHLAIFFLFLSGASFLGFRLSRMIREIEAVGSDQNAVTIVRDFLYMPFVVVGRFMSDKYSQVNIVALTLGMVIELPLKTILRLIRQWTAFIGSKQDQL